MGQEQQCSAQAGSSEPQLTLCNASSREGHGRPRAKVTRGLLMAMNSSWDLQHSTKSKLCICQIPGLNISKQIPEAMLHAQQGGIALGSQPRFNSLGQTEVSGDLFPGTGSRDVFCGGISSCCPLHALRLHKVKQIPVSWEIRGKQNL